MASTEPSPSSSFETPGHVQSFESSQMAPQDANRPVELTVVKVDPQRHPKNKRKRTQYGFLSPGKVSVNAS